MSGRVGANFLPELLMVLTRHLLRSIRCLVLQLGSLVGTLLFSCGHVPENGDTG